VRRLIAGELRKLATTRLWLWLLIASVGLTVLYAILTIAFDGTPDAFTPPLSTPEGQRTLLAVGAAAAPFAAVLGAVGMTAEFRYRTATATFLATPRRGRVVAAKLVAHAVVGVGYGVVGTAVAALVVLPWLAGRHLSLAVAAGDLPATTGGVLAAVAAFGLIGVGVGALLRDQVAAVVVLLVYLFVLENILTNVTALHDWTRYLPGQAEEALVGSTLTDTVLLAPWQGGLVLTGYGLLLAAAGTMSTVRRDIS
jgi:ABC-2 type transport system permease protein